MRYPVFLYFLKRILRYSRFSFPLPIFNIPLKAFKITAKLLLIDFKVNVFSIYLRIFKPDIVLGIDLPRSLCEAAYDQGIIVYEILHGSVNAYNFSH